MATKPLKAVIIYFTVSGHTQAAAESVAAALGADLERIEAAKPLPSNLFVLLAVGGFAATMKRAWTARPAALKFGDYDLVIIGTPIWAWSLNPVVRGWLRANPIPAEIPYAAFATVGGPIGSGAFDEMAAIVGRTPFATMTIHDADRKSGGDVRLIERFVADVRARLVSSRMELPMASISGVARKTALITGASSGIGYEFAKLFARDHFDLVLVARDASRLGRVADELRRTFGITATVKATDLSRPAAATGIYRELQDEGIEIDVLVNNAGFNVYGPFCETNAQGELEMIQTNVIALTQLTKELLPGMIERRSGKILNLGSTGSFAPGPLNAVYCASKAYVLSFSEALAEELKGTGVTVTTLCPGPTKTEFAERAQMTDTNIFQGRLQSAAEVAEAGYRALTRGETSIVVGLANKLQVFSLRFLPRDAVASVSKRIMSRSESAPQVKFRHAG